MTHMFFLAVNVQLPAESSIAFDKAEKTFAVLTIEIQAMLLNDRYTKN